MFVEFAQIIEMIFTNIGSRPARITMLGPGGYGKTPLADAALTHPRVREHYGDARYYMVTCESLLYSGALLTELEKTLGVLKAGSDSLWSRIRALIIFFYNARTGCSLSSSSGIRGSTVPVTLLTASYKFQTLSETVAVTTHTL